MKYKHFLFTIVLAGFITPSLAGLPASEQLKALKKSAEKEMAKFFRVQNSWGKCLEVARAQAKQHGALVQASVCGKGANQKWTLDGAQVKLASGKCLQPAGNPMTPGTRLQIANCNGAPKQKWKYVKEQLITPANTCVEILPAELNKNGAKVQINKCNGSKHQQWKPL